MHVFSVHRAEIEELPPVASFRDENVALSFARLASEVMEREYRVYVSPALVATFRGGKDCTPTEVS